MTLVIFHGLDLLLEVGSIKMKERSVLSRLGSAFVWYGSFTFSEKMLARLRVKAKEDKNRGIKLCKACGTGPPDKKIQVKTGRQLQYVKYSLFL